MVGKFERDGIAFQYPENWVLEREDAESGWSVTLQSPATAFLTISVIAEEAGIGAAADTALVALREVYPGLEAEPANDTIGGLPAIGYDVDFFSLDVTNTGVIRSLAIPAGTLLLLWEATDAETTNQSVCRAICVSLQIDD